MSDAVKPALTAEEWAAGVVRQPPDGRVVFNSAAEGLQILPRESEGLAA